MVLNSDATDVLDWIVLKSLNLSLAPFVMETKKSVLYSLLLDTTVRGAVIFRSFES